MHIMKRTRSKNHYVMNIFEKDKRVKESQLYKHLVLLYTKFGGSGTDTGLGVTFQLLL